MFVKQISVFLENTEGRLDEVLKILAQGGIDILSASLALLPKVSKAVTSQPII